MVERNPLTRTAGDPIFFAYAAALQPRQCPRSHIIVEDRSTVNALRKSNEFGPFYGSNGCACRLV